MDRSDTKKPRATRANPRNSAAPPTPKPKRVRATLKTINDVTQELARLYREARGGKIDTADASKLANILSLMGRMIEGSDLERRLDEIEQRQSKEQGRWPAQRH